MLLLTHIVIALLGLIQATFTVVTPSARRLQTVHALLAGTVATGICLVWSAHASLVSSCISGLAYVSLVMTLSIVARYRLSHQIAHL